MSKDPRLGKSKNFNDAVQDRIIRHSFYIESYKGKQAKDAIEFIDDQILNTLEANLALRYERIKAVGFDRGVETTRRLERQIAELTAVIDKYDQLQRNLQLELFDFGYNELDWTVQMMNNEAGINLNMTTPAAEQIRQAIIGKPFTGETLEGWFTSLKQSARDRFTREINRGVVEGRTTDQIIRAIRYEGYMDTTRRQTATVVRTAINHTANETRMQLFKQNEDIIKGYKWVATLDSRTSAICASRDGRIYQPDRVPALPAHPNCRSAITAITKSYRELGVPTDEIPRTTRSSMNGQVPEDLTYSDWLKNQPTSVQNDALGVTKAKLFRKGEFKISQFVSRRGKELSLADLRAKDPAAFVNLEE